MMVHDRDRKRAKVEAAMAILLQAHDAVGGDIVSGGGTGTFDVNTWCTEIQAGSYTLMDTQYDELDLPFEKALSVLATVVSVSAGAISASVSLLACRSRDARHARANPASQTSLSAASAATCWGRSGRPSPRIACWSPA